MVPEKTVKNFRGLLYFAAPCMPSHFWSFVAKRYTVKYRSNLHQFQLHVGANLLRPVEKISSKNIVK